MNPTTEMPVMERINEQINKMEAIIEEVQMYGEGMPCIGNNVAQIKALLRLLKMECTEL